VGNHDSYSDIRVFQQPASLEERIFLLTLKTSVFSTTEPRQVGVTRGEPQRAPRTHGKIQAQNQKLETIQ
jgi:hypothetical protein